MHATIFYKNVNVLNAMNTHLQVFFYFLWEAVAVQAINVCWDTLELI